MSGPVERVKRRFPDLTFNVEMINDVRNVVARWTMNGQKHALRCPTPTGIFNDAAAKRHIACQVIHNHPKLFAN